jgi:hypothetical protein
VSYASTLEAINERIADNWHMRGGYAPKPEREPITIVVSPPLQPILPSIVMPPPVRPDAEKVAQRVRAMHEKHLLAINELRPGHRWRH